MISPLRHIQGHRKAFWINGPDGSIDLLWPSDALWWHISGSTLAQVMACCLTTPSHYRNQCWPIIGVGLWHSLVIRFLGSVQDINLGDKIKNTLFKITATSPRGQWDTLDLPILLRRKRNNETWSRQFATLSTELSVIYYHDIKPVIYL